MSENERQLRTNVNNEKLQGTVVTYITCGGIRAALTGKHDTLVRRAPGWQGAPDGQQAKN